MKIGLISDVHAEPAPLVEALQLFASAGVETVLCAGDIAGYGSQLAATVELLKVSGCESVVGNHDLWHCEKRAGSPGEIEAYLQSLPLSRELSLAGKRLYMVHASPRDSLLDGIRLRDEFGALLPQACDDWRDHLNAFPYDVLVVGHTHQVFAQQLGATLVINPGSSCFNHSCAILTLPALTVDILPLGGKQPLLSWNFGMERRGFRNGEAG